MTELNKKIILDFLKKKSFEFENYKRVPVLTHMLNECRKFSNRNQNGQPSERRDRQFSNSHYWLPAIGYLCIIDMIGHAFQTSASPTRNHIEYALREFGGLTNQCEIDSIVSLRHSLAHNLSLLNIPTQGNISKNDYIQRFGLDSINARTIILKKAIPKWKGKLDNKSFTNVSDRTDINIYALGYLVDDMIQKIILGIDTGDIEIQPIKEIIDYDLSSRSISANENSNNENRNIRSFINKYTFVNSN